MYRVQDVFEKTTLASIATELCKLKHNDENKKAFLSFGLDLLALPTLGFSTLFKGKVMNAFKRNSELQADRFAATNVGKEHIHRIYKEFLQARINLHHKYPAYFTKEGYTSFAVEYPQIPDVLAALKS